jgi:hypothetical protein
VSTRMGNDNLVHSNVIIGVNQRTNIISRQNFDRHPLAIHLQSIRCRSALQCNKRHTSSHERPYQQHGTDVSAAHPAYHCKVCVHALTYHFTPILY